MPFVLKLRMQLPSLMLPFIICTEMASNQILYTRYYSPTLAALSCMRIFRGRSIGFQKGSANIMVGWLRKAITG